MANSEEHSTLYKIALVLEYDGTRYAGFQLQPRHPTVQGALEQALARLTQEVIRVHPASRTDAGAHAWGQVIAFQSRAARSLDSYVRGLNFHLPPDIRVQAAYQVPLAFDPKRDAYAREYHYRVLRRAAPSALLRWHAYHVAFALDLEAMRAAAGSLPGSRDFAPFSGLDKWSTIRRLDRIDVTEEGDLVTIELEGSAFLPQQVRRTAGALLQVGMKRLAVEKFVKLAHSGQRSVLGPTLPAHGLHLIRVGYADFPPRPEG
ncbi:MAG: tRNA pseudouridine(38-40) synthase TruA [Dehalococcoidia bacterium]|nr:tRNA pseudouridine(38-40) synthase TruA [Dehalococcoidia bacterium]